MPALVLLMLSPFFGLPAARTWLDWAALGAAWGFWLKYRARLGDPLLLILLALAAKVLYLSFALGCAGLLLVYTLDRSDLLGWAAAFVLTSLALPWLAGLIQAIAIQRREGVHVDAPWVQSVLDLERWAPRAYVSCELCKPSFMDRFGWTVVTILLIGFVLLQLVGLEEVYGLYLLAPVMLLPGWAGAMPAGRALGCLIGLCRFERLSGRPLRAMHEDELTELRRSFWFSRWLCGRLPPSPPVCPVPPKRQPPGRRGARSARRARR